MFKFVKFCLSLFLLIHFNRFKAVSVEWSIVLLAISICAIAIPALSLSSVIEGHCPLIILYGQAKSYSKTRSCNSAPGPFWSRSCEIYIFNPSELNEIPLGCWFGFEPVSITNVPSIVNDDVSKALVSEIWVTPLSLLVPPWLVINILFPPGLNLIPDGLSTPLVEESLKPIPADVTRESVDKSYGVERVYS